MKRTGSNGPLRRVLAADPTGTDMDRRSMIYAGTIFNYSHIAAAAKFAAFAQDQITEAFAPHDPLTVHTILSDAELAEILISFKPRFIHHPESKRLVGELLVSLGADPELTYFDVPKLRTSFPRGHLNTGIAYAFQAHRDTWYAAPPQQVNFWLPVWPVRADNSMEIYPQFFGSGVANSSSRYNYYEFNAWRGQIAKVSRGTDTRVHPAPLAGVDDEPSLLVLPPVGGVFAFSGDHLHKSTPNSSPVARYSIDFRVVNRADVEAHVGAPCIDVACAGTALRDFLRIADHERLPESLVAEYDTVGAVDAGIAIYEPDLQPVGR